MRMGVATLIGAVAASVGACVVDSQGRTSATPADALSAAEREGWYWGTQGSRMMPETWFAALEQAGSTAKFAAEDNLAGFGYIPAPPGRNSRLPIGFAIDQQPDDALIVTKLRWYAAQNGGRNAERWVGLNCAACHTAELEVGGQRVRVDGGPGLGDYDAFVAAMDAALAATRADPAKWDRFAKAVLTARRDTLGNRAMLGDAVDRLIDWQRRTEQLNRPAAQTAGDTTGTAGFARVDAFGHIYNKVQMFAGAPDPAPNASDAPVSYPFLWNIQHQKKVQWNGVAENARVAIAGGSLEYGALGRNAGEVLGVFGEASVLPAGAPGQRLRGFGSSLNVPNLDRLEAVVARLRPPAWPVAARPIDTALATRGAGLFRGACAECHRTSDLQRPGEPTEVMVPFRTTRPENQTDIWMACNAWSYDGPAGKLHGTRDGFVSGVPIGDRAPVVTLLTATVKGALAAKKGDIVAVALGNFAGLRRPPLVIQSDEEGAVPGAAKLARRALCLRTDNALLAYKARPLDGIWATAPYLHNGSVPTLYDLLLPAEQRPKTFRLGTRRYDLDRVGYATMDSGGFAFRTVDDAGKPVAGNANTGHDYGTSTMSNADRRALVEYMKTL